MLSAGYAEINSHGSRTRLLSCSILMYNEYNLSFICMHHLIKV